MHLHIRVGDKFWNKLKKQTGCNTLQIWQDALSLWLWAVSEAFRGRRILSADAQGQELRLLKMSSLEEAAKRGDRLRRES